MNPDTDAQGFADAMKALGIAFREEITPECGRIYFQALADQPLARVREAVRKAIQECTFFPRAAELRKFARSASFAGWGAEQTFLPPPKRPALEAPEAMATALGAAMATVAGAADAMKKRDAGASTMTPEQEAQRRAVLREQARMLKESA